MPLYEYECEGGHRFEEFHNIEDRNNTTCPMCKRPVHIKISPTSFMVAQPFTVVGHDGRVIHQEQTTERTPLQVTTKSGKVINV